jgi:hypothetical protein
MIRALTLPISPEISVATKWRQQRLWILPANVPYKIMQQQVCAFQLPMTHWLQIEMQPKFCESLDGPGLSLQQ